MSKPGKKHSVTESKPGMAQNSRRLTTKIVGAKKAVEKIDAEEQKKVLELLPDDDIADFSPMGVEAGTTNDKLPKVACQSCELVGPYVSEEIERGDVTFQVMRMVECSHGIVYGCLNPKVHEKISTARRLQKRFTELAQAGDVVGAKKTWKKLNNAIKAVKIRQRRAWHYNKHRIGGLPAIPELDDAS